MGPPLPPRDRELPVIPTDIVGQEMPPPLPQRIAIESPKMRHQPSNSQVPMAMTKITATTLDNDDFLTNIRKNQVIRVFEFLSENKLTKAAESSELDEDDPLRLSELDMNVIEIVDDLWSSLNVEIPFKLDESKASIVIEGMFGLCNEFNWCLKRGLEDVYGISVFNSDQISEGLDVGSKSDDEKDEKLIYDSATYQEIGGANESRTNESAEEDESTTQPELTETDIVEDTKEIEPVNSTHVISISENSFKNAKVFNANQWDQLITILKENNQWEYTISQIKAFGTLSMIPTIVELAPKLGLCSGDGNLQRLNIQRYYKEFYFFDQKPFVTTDENYKKLKLEISSRQKKYTDMLNNFQQLNGESMRVDTIVKRQQLRNDELSQKKVALEKEIQKKVENWEVLRVTWEKVQKIEHMNDGIRKEVERLRIENEKLK
ncbi:hypothetical protein DAMA08_027950 [Martiniozyma asiatica (nom. inval.)]|nr:hypothetical protein DAMA08_027950 [Martiniozyma asiatica]